MEKSFFLNVSKKLKEGIQIKIFNYFEVNGKFNIGSNSTYLIHYTSQMKEIMIQSIKWDRIQWQPILIIPDIKIFAFNVKNAWSMHYRLQWIKIPN